MSGLDNIVRSIRQEAEGKAAEIVKKARAQAEEIERECVAQLDAQKRETERQAEAEKSAVAARADSENRQLRKEALLRAKSTLIADVIRQAKSRIVALPDEEYFSLMQRLFEKNAQPGEGRLYFAQKDFERLPEGFEKRLQSGLKNGTVSLAGATDKISHGFVIVYGKIEQNCSLDSIFSSEHSRMVDAVSACLAKAEQEESI